MDFVINGLKWDVIFVNSKSNLLRRSDGSFTFGVTDRTKLLIALSEDLKGKFLLKVITHEICHASMWSYGIDLSVEQEELIADLIATYGSEIITIANKIFERLRLVA